jgi:Cu+-exporting ATPase
MHREISHTDPALERRSNLPLYLMTGLLGLLMAIDLWPALAVWLDGHGLVLPRWPQQINGYRIALVAAVLGSIRVIYSSIDSLLEGRFGADLAILLACVAALLIGEPLVAAEIVFIGMVGECLEAFTFDRAQRSLQRIVEVFPRRCWVLREGREVRILTSELQVGDLVVVKPGAKVPVDGVVREGRSAVNQSALTGEGLPVDKGPGDEVLAGSLNQFGALTIEAQRVAEQTVAGRVIELTARALKDKAPLERAADRLARYFLPMVLGLAAVTFISSLALRWLALVPQGGRLAMADLTRGVYPALAVLVVACPCPLILATPAAIIAALGRLAGTGVLIKGGSALERLAETTAVAFDKTGTITEGRLELGEVLGLDGIAPAEVFQAALTAEERSEHVIARLITQEASAKGLTADHPVDEFLAHPGAGVTARSRSHTFVVGGERLLAEQGIAVPPAGAELLARLNASGQTALLVARNNVVLGVIGARDRIRPEATGIIADLRGLGIRDLALLTGDRATVARTVAESLGITEVHADLLPEQKAEFVQDWQKRHKVAMVGDGINDAPALARADIGLAVGGTGTDVAAEAGDIVLMGDPLRSLPFLLRLSRETVRIIRQNIVVFAFGVNGLGIVLTAWLWPLFAPTPGWYEQSPLAAVIYHQLGSLAVLLNAMRLLWFDRTASSPTWQAMRRSLTRFDHWLEHALDGHALGHWLEHHWAKALAGAAALFVAAYALAGFVQIGPDEAAVVRRFGRPVAELQPGLHWQWPWPVDEVTRVQPARIHVIELGFRTAAGRPAPATLTWASPHSGGEGIERLSDEAVMITGDANLIELQATIRYALDPARLSDYLFGASNVDQVVRAITESVLRETVAGEPFLDLLTTRREAFQREILARIRQRCSEYGPLGIRVEGLALHDLHPPQEVVPDYHRVAEAMEKRDRQINEAQAEATWNRRQAAAGAIEIVQRAQAAAHEVVQQADASRAAFLARYAQRNRLGLRDELRLLCGYLGALLQHQTPASAYRDYQNRRREFLALQASLTDFRLFWDGLARALDGRDKVLIDADNVPGRRQLWMVDPEQFRIPVPVPVPRSERRAPPREPVPNEEP